MQKNSVNKVIIVGNLGQDPESRFTPQGTAVTSFSVATNESWKNQSGEVVEHTEWHRIELYGKRAETANQYMRKGHTVYIEGRLKTDEWEDKETGQKRSKLKVVGESMQLLGSRDSGSGGDASSQSYVQSLPGSSSHTPHWSV